MLTQNSERFRSLKMWSMHLLYVLYYLFTAWRLFFAIQCSSTSEYTNHGLQRSNLLFGKNLMRQETLTTHTAGDETRTYDFATEASKAASLDASEDATFPNGLLDTEADF